MAKLTEEELKTLKEIRARSDRVAKMAPAAYASQFLHTQALLAEVDRSALLTMIDKLLEETTD